MAESTSALATGGETNTWRPESIDAAETQIEFHQLRLGRIW
jgi:hypothetical protein